MWTNSVDPDLTAPDIGPHCLPGSYQNISADDKNRRLLLWLARYGLKINRYKCTVLPAKSDSDFMFCLQSYQGLINDRSLVY